MLTEICAEVRNWFADDEDKHVGVFEVKNGVLAPLDFLTEGQYFRIIGSKYNDGVYAYPDANLVDEDFSGAVLAMKVPPDFLKLCCEIGEYEEKYGSTAYVSESWGGYSYTLPTGENGAPMSWNERFAKRLARWRKM